MEDTDAHHGGSPHPGGRRYHLPPQQLTTPPPWSGSQTFDYYEIEGERGPAEDHIDNKIYRHSLHNTKIARPQHWPKSVSEMRRHTSYLGQELNSGKHDTDHSKYVMRRPYNPPAAQPSRVAPQGPAEELHFNHSLGKWVRVRMA